LTSTLERLENLGWVLPGERETGVRSYAPEDETAISFPSAAYEEPGVGVGDQGFYLSHRAEVLIALLARLGVSAIWEVGAGNGNMAVPMAKSGLEVVAVEPLMSGAEVSAHQGVTSICATFEELALPDGSLPAVGMFDVLEHLRDPLPLLREVHRVLESDGILVITVPAGPWLWSELDESLGHFRRYRKKTLLAEIVPVGFQTVAAENIYASLVPAAAVLRSIPFRLGRRKSKADVLAEVLHELNVPRAVDRAARLVLRAETRVAQLIPLPWGLSLMAAFRKRGVPRASQD
jgi:SAM-dependent methyltransferase